LLLVALEQLGVVAPRTALLFISIFWIGASGWLGRTLDHGHWAFGSHWQIICGFGWRCFFAGNGEV
jgi:hypothetical protein